MSEPQPLSDVTLTMASTAISSHQNNQQSHFPFLSLPAELRNEIYTLSIAAHYEIVKAADWHYIPPPALLAVNQQTRAESLPVYHARTVLRISHPTRRWPCILASKPNPAPSNPTTTTATTTTTTPTTTPLLPPPTQTPPRPALEPPVPATFMIHYAPRTHTLQLRTIAPLALSASATALARIAAAAKLPPSEPFTPAAFGRFAKVLAEVHEEVYLASDWRAQMVRYAREDWGMRRWREGAVVELSC